MPIKHNIPVRQLTDDEFHRRDYKVMGLVFNAHKELGRMCDEDVYREFLRLRCCAAGFESVATEKQIVLWHEDFKKRQFMDLLVDDGIIYELKIEPRLTGDHQMQLLDYLLLTGIPHGKLVNLRPRSVEYRFVSMRLTAERQREFQFEKESWRPQSDRCAMVEERLLRLFQDWGVFLRTGLYTEALTHFLGGENKVIRRIEIVDGHDVLGRQRFHLIDGDVAFRITAVTQDLDNCQGHLKRLLNHTRLKAIQWINLNHHVVTLRTLTHNSP
jgi:GxxExxY protein